MRKFLLPVAISAAATYAAISAGEKVPATGPVELVERLGSDSYPLRMEATRALWELGEEVEELLLLASESQDPEVAKRAKNLLRKVQLGILPDSPPEVVALILRYDSASPAERQKIVVALKNLRAWQQVLRIHELERDPETLRRIAKEMEGVSVEAARELLAGEDPDLEGAKQLLEMGRPEPSQLMALADFHRATGTLEQELEQARSLEGEAGHLWRYVLLAASGDLSEAAEEAAAAGQDMTAARLMLLNGDPLEWIKKAKVPKGELPPDSLEAYREAVIGLWEGVAVPESFLKELASSVHSSEDDQSMHSLSALYALGDANRADSLLGRMSTSMAVTYFDSIERVDEVLDALGIDRENPDYEGWAAKRFKVLMENPDDGDEELAELKMLGSFLERRGLKEELEQAFVGHLVALGEKDPETFVEVIARLFLSYSSSILVASPVLDAAAEFAAGDEARWGMIRDRLFGEGAHVMGLWDAIGLYQPEIEGADRLDLFVRVLGEIPDPDGLADDWWEWAWDEAEKGEKLERVDQLGLMLALSALNPNANRFLKVTELAREAGFGLDGLGKFSDDYLLKSYEILCLGATGQWAKVAKSWQTEVDAFPSDPMKHAYLAGALRRVGKEEQAKNHDLIAARLALGQVETLRKIGQAYASSGDFVRAREWWMRAAVESTTGDLVFYYAAMLTAEGAMEAGDWLLAASLGEMKLLYQMMRGDALGQPAGLLRGRIEVEFARALAGVEDDRDATLASLKRCHQIGLSDGSMADYFFPALRKAGFADEHNQWFEESWSSYEKVLERFPKSYNTMNTAAWTAARANRRLDEAEILVERALDAIPGQAAYLDTMGEIWFSRRNREKALEWSDRAVLRSPGESSLLRQYQRFESGEFSDE